MNRAVFASLTIVCLLSVSSIRGLIHLARADGGSITINADGSITPSTAPITTVDNVTYTLTGNVNESIVVERDNVVLNGAGYTVTGSGSGNGTTLMNVSNVAVTNMTITNFDNGIYLASSSNNTLSCNNVTNKVIGIFLWESSNNNTLSGNNAANNYAGIYLYSSSNSTLLGNSVANNENGIVLYNSSNNSIFYNSFVNNTNYQAYTDGSANSWDNGSRGNYWSNYLTKYPNATQVDSSGVWNTPYMIDPNNTDYYPLTVPYAIIPEFLSFLILPLMMMATLLAVIVCKKKRVKTSQS